MALYTVRMDHRDASGWNEHVVPHLHYLKSLIDRGSLIASGPLRDAGHHAGFLIFKAASREDVERLVADDPFAKEGLISDLRIEEWDPLFGALGDHSDTSLPPEIASLFRN